MNGTTIKNQRGRSRAYPVMALGEALEKITHINSNLGMNGQFNRESMAAGMGYSSLNGSSSRRIAALVQYGLLNRVKDLYFLSDAAKKYLFHIGDNDQTEVIQEAALTPPLFADIYKTLRGQVLPKQFVNRLIQEFEIEQKAASDVDRIFKSTMITAGILRSNGILEAINLDYSESHILSPEKPSTNPTTQSQSLDCLVPVGYQSVELPSGIIICYSKDLASEFAFGTFGLELKALNDSIAKHYDLQINKRNEEV